MTNLEIIKVWGLLDSKREFPYVDVYMDEESAQSEIGKKVDGLLIDGVVQGWYILGSDHSSDFHFTFEEALEEKKELLQNEIKEYLLNDSDTLKDIVREIISWNGELDHLDYQNNDEEFFHMCFEGDVMGVLRAANFGDYNYNDDYVKLNGYGNLKSVTECEFEEELKSEIDDIIKALLDSHSSLHIHDGDLVELLEDYENKGGDE